MFWIWTNVSQPPSPPPHPPLSDFFRAGAAFQCWRSSREAFCPPPPLKQSPWRRPSMIFDLFVLLVSSAVNHVNDDNTPTHKKKCVGVFPPPPPRSSAFLGLERLSRLAAAVARHFAPPPFPQANTLAPPLRYRHRQPQRSQIKSPFTEICS